MVRCSISGASVLAKHTEEANLKSLQAVFKNPIGFYLPTMNFQSSPFLPHKEIWLDPNSAFRLWNGPFGFLMLGCSRFCPNCKLNF